MNYVRTGFINTINFSVSLLLNNDNMYKSVYCEILFLTQMAILLSPQGN